MDSEWVRKKGIERDSKYGIKKKVKIESKSKNGPRLHSARLPSEAR